MQIINGARIAAQLAVNLAKGRVFGRKPFFLSHLVTARCNFDCHGCLWKDNKAESLRLDEIRSLYRQAKMCGFVGNYIWGGEPLIRKDIAEIVSSSKAAGMVTMINTNGWFVQEKLGDLATNLDVLLISLDHSTAAGHDAVRRMAGSYDRVIDAIDLAKTNFSKLRLVVNTVVLKHNADDIDALLLLWKRLKVSGYVNFIEVDLSRSTGMGDQNEDVDISETERRELSRMLLARKAEGFPILNTNDYFQKFVHGKQAYRCHFPKMFLEVYPDGSVLDCVRVDQPIGNVRRSSLKRILSHPRIQGMIDDGERWCHVHNNADRIDVSNTWELHRESVSTGFRFMFGRS